jgi:hypothetical protein
MWGCYRVGGRRETTYVFAETFLAFDFSITTEYNIMGVNVFDGAVGAVFDIWECKTLGL